MPQRSDTSSPIQILVVDDEPEICSILRSGLEKEGYAVSEAGSKAGLSAISMASSELKGCP